LRSSQHLYYHWKVAMKRMDSFNLYPEIIVKPSRQLKTHLEASVLEELRAWYRGHAASAQRTLRLVPETYIKPTWISKWNPKARSIFW
jgi:hypothetical protein